MAEAFRLASEWTEREALKRRQRIDKLSTDKLLIVGSRVFRRNHFKGRCKIQDIWDPTPLKVVEVCRDNVYIVEPVDGGAGIKLHRSELLDSRTLVEDIGPTSVSSIGGVY